MEERLKRTVTIAAALALTEILLATPVRAQETINIGTPALVLRLEDWQKGSLRWGAVALLTGAYLSRVGSTLRQNEGSSRWQRRWNNVGLIAAGTGTVLIDTVILTTPI